MARPWTRAQDALARKHPPRQAAELTGHPLSSVCSRRFKLGVPDRRTVRFSHWTQAADQIVRTKSPAAARSALGLSKSTIVRRRRLLGLPMWKPPAKPRPPPKRQTTLWSANEDR